MNANKKHLFSIMEEENDEESICINAGVPAGSGPWRL